MRKTAPRAGMMEAWSSPLLFSGDYLLFVLVYAIYIYGLAMSYTMHRSLVPFARIALHLACLAIFLLAGQPEWSGYATVFSLMLTSVVNQYHRNGSLDCAGCGDGACRY